MIAALVAAALATASSADAKPSRTCISILPGNDASYTAVDDRTVLIDAQGRHFKLSVTPSSLLTQPFTVIANTVGGPHLLCSRLDFRLRVITQPDGNAAPVVAQDFAQISEAEARALRAKARARR